jgi:4-hydroxy-tetrahydrodipicolinate reductase
MKIALLGYGKMGKAIEFLAEKHGVEICAKIGRSDALNFNNAQAVIEFTEPGSAKNNIIHCIKSGIPVVSGTTGWQNDFEEVKNYCLQKEGSFLWASNFSVGVNLFFALNQKLAQLMSAHKQYQSAITEIHHIHKKDAPSGTAVTLAEGIIANIPAIKKWHLKDTVSGEPNASLPITALRENEVPGTHTVFYESDIDEISITHKANSRLGFAEGAIIAAKFIANKKGVFTMQDVLNL